MEDAVKDLECLELTCKGALTVAGECVQNMPFSLEVAIALVAGAFLGVGRQIVNVLAIASNHLFLRNSLQDLMQQTTHWILGGVGIEATSSPQVRFSNTFQR